jgi:hypothetical protein
VEHLIQTAETASLDILIIVETWLVKNATNPFKGLAFIDQREKFTGRRGQGGIMAVAMNKSLLPEITVLHLSDTHCEFMIRGLRIVAVYLKPSLSHENLKKLLGEYKNATDVLIIGDFNAKHHELGTSTDANARGTILYDELHNFDYCHPIQGCYSMRTAHTRPDHAIKRGDRVANDLIIHEDIFCLSDHNLITITAHLEMSTNIPFERLNYAALRNKCKREMFQNKVTEALKGKLASFVDEYDKLVKLTQEDIDNSWSKLCNTLIKALEDSVGIFRYQSRVNPEFKTAKMESLEADVRLFQEAVKSSPRDQKMKAALNFSKKKLFQEYATQKSRLYRKFSEALEQGANSAFLRLANCQKSRETKSGCKLDPNKMDEHESYFNQTFGAPPQGCSTLKEPHILQSTECHRWNKSDNVTPDPDFMIQWQEIHEVTRWLLAGKAPGVDQLPPEVWIFPVEMDSVTKQLTPPPLYELLAIQFTMFLITNLIPSSWKEAIICPVFKKKGSDQDIANYRPIAITCAIRRIFEKIIKRRIEPIIERNLADEQNGFRAHRNTLQHVVMLDAISNAHPACIYSFLDMKAAYDTVDRDILWCKLVTKFQMSHRWVSILRTLFDTNKARLRIRGQLSDGVDVTRGLLQGSSLSPLLFNAYINDLITDLNSYHVKINIRGIRLNNLFFADDIVLLALEEKSQQTLLRKCETWSIFNGSRFAPAKCEVVADRAINLTLYGEDMPQSESFKYLGIPMNHNGIVWKEHFTNVTRKCWNMTSLLRSKGFNGNGWTPNTSVLAYKAFLRPIMEYGLALQPLDVGVLKPLESAQRKALLSAFSVAGNTSNLALLTLTGLPSMETRNLVLNSRLMMQLHELTDKRILAARLYWKVKSTGPTLLSKNQAGQDCITQSIRNNRLLKSFELRNIITRPTFYSPNLKDQEMAHLRFLKNRAKWKAFPDEVRRTNLCKEFGSVAGSLLPWSGVEVDLGRPSPLILQGAYECPEDRRSVILWCLGRVALHQYPCFACGEPLSRQHAVECSGTETSILEDYPEITDYPVTKRYNILDLFIQSILAKVGFTVFNEMEALGFSPDEAIPECRLPEARKAIKEYNQLETQQRLASAAKYIRRIREHCWDPDHDFSLQPEPD